MIRGAVLTLMLSAPAFAGSVLVLNAGFENPVLADGAFVRGIPNWNIGGAFGPGVYNPTVSSHPAQAPEGQNVGFTQGSNDVWQDLGVVLTANTNYTLQVDFGTPAGATSFLFELRLNTASFFTLASTPGTVNEPFQTFTVNFSPGAADPHLGQQLEIMIHGVAGTDELDFDNVRLDASPAAVGAPEPATWMGMVGALLWGAGLKARVTRRGSSRSVLKLRRGCRIGG